MQVRKFIGKLFEKFVADDTTTLAASLAFYTALSMAPLLILFVTISAELSSELQSTFISEVRGLMGRDAANAIEMVIASAAQRRDLVSMANIIGLGTVLVSASLIFGQLRATLNKIFAIKLQENQDEGWLRMTFEYFRGRLLHIGLALSFIFTLIVSLIAASFFTTVIPTNDLLLMLVLNFLVSMMFYVSVFTLLFRFLPDARLPWNHAAQGGALTAVLFVVGRELISLYLSKSAIGSSYGAAGSVIVLLVWVYYSALITFIGAQVSFLLHQEASGRAGAGKSNRA